MLQDAADYHEASYTPDVAREIDSIADHVAELVEEEWSGPVDQLKNVQATAEIVVRRLLDERRLNEAVDVAQMSGRDVLAGVVAMVVESDRPRLVARAVDLVFQLGAFGGMSETQMAQVEGCTRANVCHYVMAIKDRFFHGKSVPWLRSEQARDTYSKRQTGKVAKSEEWPFIDAIKSQEIFKKTL